MAPLRVTVYTKPRCQPCRGTKRKLDELDIPYGEMPLDDTTRAYVESLGYTSAPVVEVDYGEGVTTSWSGYRPERIKQIKDTLGN